MGGPSRENLTGPPARPYRFLGPGLVITGISTDTADPPAFIALAARRAAEGTVPSRYDIAAAPLIRGDAWRA